MKTKNLLFIPLMLLSLLVTAQNTAITFVSLTMDPLDQAAKLHPKTDVNGDLYALVKVRPACDDLKFSFGLMKCLPDNVKHDGETWLYVQKNARYFSISGEGYETVRNRDLTQTLEAGVTYVMELKFAEEKAEEAVAASAYQYVVFRVAVLDAIIRINGKTLKPKDGVVSAKLPLGRHDYEVSAPMYETTIGVLTADDSQTKQEVPVSLRPLFKEVKLTVADGAEIWIDGERKANGSWTGNLEFTNYSIECRKAGYKTSQQDIVISREGPSAYTLTAPTPMYGSIEVEVEPVDAEVWLDGKRMGTTPMLLSKVLAGKHEIKLIKSRFEELTKTVTVEENGTLTLEGTMKEALDNSNNSDNGRNTHNGHEYVDLGLTSGTLWATCNVGASKPEEYGDYFAWGETTGYNSGKTNFDWSTYKWCNGSSSTMTKYCTESSYGTVDNKKELELSDDAARANWGGQWRMPSSAQIDELMSECNIERTSQNGVYGRKVTSKKNGKSIFLPAAGFRGGSSLIDAGSYGYFWSRSLDESYSSRAYDLYFYSNIYGRGYSFRFCSKSVRPVVAE